MGEPVLRRRAEEVPRELIGTPRLESLIDDMIDTMRDADGAGLAAPQIYESLRLVVIEVGRNPRYPTFEPIPLTVLINPVVTPLGYDENGGLADEDSVIMYEGCLSVAGIRGQVKRPRKVEVTALDREGRPLSFTWEGVRAAVIQHETDHLNGVLYIDRADPRTLTFLREYERHVPLAERVMDRGQPSP